MLQFNHGQYTIQGMDVLQLVEKYGSPLYVYDLAKIKSQYGSLKNAFKGVDLHIKYACKALTNINILRYLKQLGSGLDTVSINEVKIGLQAGFAPQDIIFTPNGVSLAEIQAAVDLGVVINIDNISILEQFGHLYGDSVPVCIRINPHIFAGGNHQISVGHIDSKFGISIYQMRHVERIVKSTDLKVVGLHMHTGSDILNVEAFLRAVDILLDTTRYFKALDFIDLGSGFKVAYKPNGIATDIARLGQKLSEQFAQFCKDYGKEVALWFEPGKFIVSESGTFLTEVNVVKPTPATVFAGVDSGFNHLIRPMFYNAHHEMVNVSNPTGRERIYTIVGYICETDTFGSDRRLCEVREGDILAFKNAGAYGFEMASNFNARCRPAEVMIHQGKDYLIRRRETLEDLLSNQIDVFQETFIQQENGVL